MISSSTHRIAVVLAALAALVAVTGIAQAARPAGMTKAEYRALILRSEGFNQKYGLGGSQVDPSLNTPPGMTRAEYRALMLRSSALNRKFHLGEWKNVPQGMTPAEHHALVVRSEGLNKRYGLGEWSTAGSNRVTTVATNGFSWGAFGMGVAAAFGLVLLAGGLVAGSRHARQSTSVRTS